MSVWLYSSTVASQSQSQSQCEPAQLNVVFCFYPICRDGRSRCFGFVGFASIEDAAAALKYFNRTYMDTSKLEVEYAYKYGATNQRPLNAWSKYTQGTSAHSRMLRATGEAEGSQSSKKTGAKAVKKDTTKKPEEGRNRRLYQLINYA